MISYPVEYYLPITPPIFPAGGFAPPVQPGDFRSRKPPVNIRPIQATHQNQPPSAQPEKTWLNAGIEEAKKGARLSLITTLAYGTIPFLYLLGRLIASKKVVPSDWKKWLYGVTCWGMISESASFAKGVSENHFKNNPLPKATSPTENGILAVRKSWAAYAAVGTIFSLMITPVWKKEKPVGVKPFLSLFWKNFRWWTPAMFATCSAIEFGRGAYQFGKPPKDKSA